jgi:methyl-accepting chemotaxis protein
MNPEAPKTRPVRKGSGDHSPPREPARSLFAIAARDKLLLTFCLLAFIAILANIKFIIDLRGDLFELSHVLSGQAMVDLGNPGKDPQTVDGIKRKMLFALGIMIVSFGAIIILYVKRVIEPLHSLSETAREISMGNLSVTAPAGRDSDFGKLGAVINELAANFQEVLLLTGTTAGNSRCSLEAIEKTLDSNKDSPVSHEVQEQVNAIKKDLELLGSVVKEFEFYHARFDGRKVVPLSSRPKT